MNIHTLFLAIDAVTIFSAAILGIHLLLALPSNRNARLAAAVLASGICHVVLARQSYGYWIPGAFDIDVGAWAPLLNIGRNMGPALHMLFCYSLFQEPRTFPRWLFGLIALQLFLEEPVHLFIEPGAPAERFWTETAPSLLQSLFIVFSVYWAIAEWRADLVETRRRMRALVLVIIGASIVASSLLLRVLIPSELVASYYVHMGLVSFQTLFITFFIVLLMGSDAARYLDTQRLPARLEPRTKNRREDEALARLRDLLDNEHIYREPGLALRDLATRMQMPEYRLRRLIHEELGYRNFNVLLHEYRIREAREMLRDPAMARTPILTIALTVGYASVNTFNRGFRAVTGMTPSAYRERTDGDSETRNDGSTPLEDAGS